jgi:AAA domain
MRQPARARCVAPVHARQPLAGWRRVHALARRDAQTFDAQFLHWCDAMSQHDESLEVVDPVAAFRIPRLRNVPGVIAARTALKQAVDHRGGVVLVGPMGVGKSEGVHTAKLEFRADEHEAYEARPEVYERRRVVYVHLLSAVKPRALLLALLRAAKPGLVRERTHGSSKSDDELRAELYATYRQQHTVLMIVDDAQRLSDAGLLLLRDLIAAQDNDKDAEDDGGEPHDAAASAAGIAAVGVGVLLVGTPELADRMVKTRETHGVGRWKFTHTVDAVPDEQVPLIYEAIFPAFAQHVAAVGRRAWEAFVSDQVAPGGTALMRVVTTHAREYFAVLYDRTKGAVDRRESTPFDRAVFVETLARVEWRVPAKLVPKPVTDVVPPAVPVESSDVSTSMNMAGGNDLRIGGSEDRS